MDPVGFEQGDEGVAPLDAEHLEIAAHATARRFLSSRDSTRRLVIDLRDHVRTAPNRTRRAFWSRVMHLVLSERRTKYNPRGGAPRTWIQFGIELPALPGAPSQDKVYDPRLESIRGVARGTEGRWDIAIGKYAGQHDVKDIVQRSWERYQEVDHLIRARQAYELMLSGNRARAVYRIEAEPTMAGWSYFVWPLHSGQAVPRPFRTLSAAQAFLLELRRRRTAPAAALPGALYTRDMLKDWLPPDHIFSLRSRVPTRASERPHRNLLPGEQPVGGSAVGAEGSPSTPAKLVKAYRAYSLQWYQDAQLVESYTKGLPPPKR